MGGRRQGRHGQEREGQQRQILVREAARIMAEDGVQDFAVAKRKAAERLGLGRERNLPKNSEIEQALREHQSLFLAQSQPRHLHQLRQHALKAMELLERFEPRLVGPVLSGTADRHNPVTLHLFADTPEQVALFLLEQQIPFTEDERGVRYEGGQLQQYPCLRFVAGEAAIELVIFPPKGLRQPPLSPVDGLPMQRAKLGRVQALLQQND